MINNILGGIQKTISGGASIITGGADAIGPIVYILIFFYLATTIWLMSATYTNTGDYIPATVNSIHSVLQSIIIPLLASAIINIDQENSKLIKQMASNTISPKPQEYYY